jgi:uncharacterized protein (DUF1330 family)
LSEDIYVDPERAAFEAFKSLPRDRPIEMLNLICLREIAIYPSAHPDAAESTSGNEAYRRYSSSSGPIFRRVGGTIVWSGRPEIVLIGPSDERWDLAFVARYPTASAFLEMVTDEAYRQAVVHRQAAVETSRLIRTSPKGKTASSFG